MCLALICGAMAMDWWPLAVAGAVAGVAVTVYGTVRFWFSSEPSGARFFMAALTLAAVPVGWAILIFAVSFKLGNAHLGGLAYSPPFLTFWAGPHWIVAAIFALRGVWSYYKLSYQRIDS